MAFNLRMTYEVQYICRYQDGSERSAQRRVTVFNCVVLKVVSKINPWISGGTII